MSFWGASAYRKKSALLGTKKELLLACWVYNFNKLSTSLYG